VAIGDSSTEGLDDPDGNGGYRGWADRLAGHIAAAQGSLLYANLGIRGRQARQILEEQLEPALAMRPDLATVFAGSNDVVRRRLDLEAVSRDVESMQSALIDSGATVLTFTLPDLSRVMPIGRLAAGRVHLFNDELRRISERTGSILVDFAAHNVASDPRFWSEDRFHANTLGHERIAGSLAHALGLPGHDPAGIDAPSDGAPRSRARQLASDLAWTFGYFLPWLIRHARGRSSGDGRRPKRPELTPVAQSSQA
jgi:lysophospholipase L1-like esterase